MHLLIPIFAEAAATNGGDGVSFATFAVSLVVAAIAGWFVEYFRGNSDLRQRFEEQAQAAIDSKIGDHKARVERIENRLDGVERDQRDHENKVTNEIAGLRVWISEHAAGKDDVEKLFDSMQSLNNRITELAVSRPAHGHAVKGIN